MTKAAAALADNQTAYWQGEIERAKKRYRTFWDNGDQVVDVYRLQKSDGNDIGSRDKYNILYSSTETIRPNLYAQTPKTRVVLRSKDTASDTARMAARLIEADLGYLVQEEDFDELMGNVVEDYMLPGLGQGWVRYEANFGDAKDKDGKPVPAASGKKDEYQQELLDEMVKMDYLYWGDFLMGVGRTWVQVPWVAKRCWMNKKEATKRFDARKAALLQYRTRESSGRDMDNPSETAEVWEIWDKTSKTVYWYAEGVTELLDEKPDPLKLKNFFPCPRPLRAISNTRTMVPRALYSQYKSQAETLNVMTKRIRLLSEALKVVGFYDAAQPKLADALNPTYGNKMIAVDGWAQFAQAGGMAKSVDWVPIDKVVEVLNQLLAAREVCKQEIYEITGFSDIVRGVSKASETLGAQNLKANWAGARVKKMQAEVQRFARDMLAMAGELVAEHCSPETIVMFAGIEIPPAAQVAQDPDLQKKVQQITEACALVKSEMRRVSIIDIETDSTLLADETAEREDRTKFLAAAGAFLQQSVPAMEATPELGPLLGAMLMFVVRTFPTSRPIEDEFEKVQEGMASRAQNQDQDKDGSKAKAAAAAQAAQADAALKDKELSVRQAADTAKMQADQVSEQNRHDEKMADLQLQGRLVGVKERELALAEGELANKTALAAAATENARTAKFTALHDAALAEQGQEAQIAKDAEQLELSYDQLDDAGKAREDAAALAKETAAIEEEKPAVED